MLALTTIENSYMRRKKKNDYDRVIVDYDQALKIEPQDAKAYYNRGFVYAKKEER